jgi:hypothetical protein
LKLYLLRWLMAFAWTIEDYAKEFVEYAQQKYSDELHGIGRVK